MGEELSIPSREYLATSLKRSCATRQCLAKQYPDPEQHESARGGLRCRRDDRGGGYFGAVSVCPKGKQEFAKLFPIEWGEPLDATNYLDTLGSPKTQGARSVQAT